MSANFTQWMQNFMDYSMQGYFDALGFLVWPLIFTAIVGYVYMKNQSAVAAVAAILLIFGAFGDALAGAGTWYAFMHIVVALVMTALLLIFVTKLRR